MKAQVLLLAVLLCGCDQGRVSIEVGDAPADAASQVIVQFSAVVFEKSDGAATRFALTPAFRIDLLQQQRGLTERLLDQAELEEGDYKSVRFEVDADGSTAQSSVLPQGGTEADRVGLQLASADESRLSMPITFRVERDEDLELVVDFDLRQSLRPRTGTDPFPLRPLLRIHRADDVGSISGNVDRQNFADGCTPWVYAWSGNDRTPDDLGSALDPYSSAEVRVAGTIGNGDYKIGLLPVGDYTLAFTCQGDADALDTDDPAVSFAQARNVHVSAGRDTLSDF